jgi:hypothetical protein
MVFNRILALSNLAAVAQQDGSEADVPKKRRQLQNCFAKVLGKT